MPPCGQPLPDLDILSRPRRQPSAPPCPRRCCGSSGDRSTAAAYSGLLVLLSQYRHYKHCIRDYGASLALRRVPTSARCNTSGVVLRASQAGRQRWRASGHSRIANAPVDADIRAKLTPLRDFLASSGNRRTAAGGAGAAALATPAAGAPGRRNRTGGRFRAADAKPGAPVPGRKGPGRRRFSPAPCRGRRWLRPSRTGPARTAPSA